MTVVISIIMLLLVTALTAKVILSEHQPHFCKRNELYWEDEFSRGTFCAICGKTISEDNYEMEI